MLAFNGLFGMLISVAIEFVGWNGVIVINSNSYIHCSAKFASLSEFHKSL